MGRPDQGIVSIDPRALRDCLGCFATGVAIITANDGSNQHAGVTVNSFASVSLDPPLILWSLRQDSRSLAAFQASPGFIVNILAADQLDLAKRFAGRSDNKWAGVQYEKGLYGISRLVGVHAALECEKYAKYDGGDHVIFVGRTVAISLNEAAKPLVYYRGGYRDVVIEVVG